MVQVTQSSDMRDLRFFDPVENVYTRLSFPSPIDPEPATESPFLHQVDKAIAIETDRIDSEVVPAVTVRAADGKPRTGSPQKDGLRYDNGPSLIEISTPIKVYVVTDGACTIRGHHHRLSIEFDGIESIAIGARVPREAPRQTMSTTMALEDLCTAISTFGSAMQSFGPERSYPSLRGHPPLLEVADSIQIPDGLSIPDTGIVFELPADRLDALLASPLCYYLGAQLRIGEESRILVNGEPYWVFNPTESFGEQCSALLDRILFLDCMARYTWEYNIDLAERDRLLARSNVDLQSLSTQPYEDRLFAYLDIQLECYEDIIPNWRRSAYLIPTERAVQSLPYLVFDLFALREHTPTNRRLTRDAESGLKQQQLSSCQSWQTVGAHVPVGFNRAYPAAFEHRYQRNAVRDAIKIVVICNDDMMADELASADDIYRRRDDPFVIVESHEKLTCSELETVLQQSADYLHFIGHIDGRGFECTDGWFDAATLDAAGVEVCFLNACSSMPQAIALIEAGVCGAIATETRVLNSVAVRMGEQLSDVLIHGFPIGVGLQLVRPHRGAGHQYTVIGDPTVAISQNDSGIPYTCTIEQLTEDTFEFGMYSALSSLVRAGSACCFRINDQDRYYLIPTNESVTVDHETLESYLTLERFPVMTDQTLHWSTEPLSKLISAPTDQ